MGFYPNQSHDIYPTWQQNSVQFGTVMSHVLHRIYSLCCHYGPTVDLVIHAKDIKSVFCQGKLHQDIIGAFSYIIANKLFLSCGQPFGMDFSPANWEVIHQVLEHLATSLFRDTSLHSKHQKLLDKLN